jgi:hypothetical protein
MVAATGFAMACMEGPQAETLVNDLVVLSVVADPPEAAPGETVSMAVSLGLPNDTPVDFMLWTCLPLGEDSCLEEGAAQRFILVEDAQSTTLVEQTVPFEAAGIVAAFDGEIPVLVWSMACEQSLCPLLEKAKSGDVVEADLADPISALKTLPFDGVSLALSTIWLSDREPEERRQNPILTPDFELPEAVVPGERLPLLFNVEGAGDETEAFGYSLSGGFGAVSTRVFEGKVELVWFAPETVDATEETQLWAVIQDADGGSATWTATLKIVPEG